MNKILISLLCAAWLILDAAILLSIAVALVSP